MIAETLGIFFDSFFSLIPVTAILFYATVTYLPTGLLLHYDPPVDDIPQHLRRLIRWGGFVSSIIFIIVLLVIFSTLTELSITNILIGIFAGLKGNSSEFGVIVASLVGSLFIKAFSFFLSGGIILFLIVIGCDIAGVISIDAFQPIPHFGMSAIIFILIIFAKVFPYASIFISGRFEDIIEKLPESISTGMNSIIIVYIHFIPLGLYCSYLVSQAK
jgi:hypothetical protein